MFPPPTSFVPSHRIGKLILGKQGLRGIACCLVVMAHGWESFAIPENSFDARPYIFGLPIFKLVFEGGYLSVPVFFVMSGYVCSMKPLKLSRAGKPDEARKSIATSAFKRIIRLAIPASVATIISWFLANTGGFDLAMTRPGNCWLNFHSGRPSDTWYEAIRSLFHNLVCFPFIALFSHFW